MKLMAKKVENYENKIGRMIFTLILLCFSAFPENIAADLVIVNAKIHTMDKAVPQAEAIAISGNKIFAVGTNKKIRALVGANTKTIDAGGKLVLPGFNDAHVHFTGIGNQFSSIDLRDAKTPQEVVKRIKYYVQFLPKGRWILGGAWNHENWTPNALPSKELIDSETPDNPVFIYHSNARMVLANSLALKLAGIDKNRKYVKDGPIARNEKGEPTGILKDSAIIIVRNIIPQLPIKNWSEVAETASNYAASLGVTSVQDVHSDNLIEVYRELFRQGKLKTRIYDCLPLSDWKKLAQAGIRRANGDAMIRGGCLKHFSDGYYDEMPELYKDILAADKADLQVMMHAIGGSANDIVLTIFERVAKENGTKDRRFRVEHAHNFRPQDLRRFGASKTIASMQPHLFFGGEPYRTLLDTGATLAFGSDASITDFNPLYGIYAAVNHGISEGGSSISKQTISVEEAVRAYTVGSAYAEFQENVKGTLTVGKLADLVILSDDIFTMNRNDIGKTRVLTTIVDGRVVFESK